MSGASASAVFSGYRRLMWITVVGVLLLAVAVLAVEVIATVDAERERDSNEIATWRHSLSAIFASSSDHVEAMRVAAETYLSEFATAPEPPSPLFSALIASLKDGAKDGAGNEVLALTEPLPPGHTTATTGNFSAFVRPPDRGFRREAEMALFLNPLFRLARRSVPDAYWVYYVSVDGMVNVFPWADGNRTSVVRDMPRNEFFTAAAPAANPARKTIWTSAYLDGAGAGLMVTVSAPVYDGDRFMGVLCLDLTLHSLNSFLLERERMNERIFIVNDRGQLIAHPSLVHDADTKVKAMGEAFPAGLRDQMTPTAILEAPFTRKAGWEFHTAKVDGTPFTLVLMVANHELIERALSGSPFTLAALMLGLGAILVISTLAIRRQFIRPSECLLTYIEGESRGSANPLPNVPAPWRPWFETIHRVFFEHAQLVAIQQELLVASRMQQAILPNVFPARGDVEVAARMTPAKQVGGDFYDFFWLDDSHLALVIADVSDKGVPAALLMAVSRTMLRAVANRAESPGACLAEVNDLLAEDNEQAMFVTVFYAILDVVTGRLSYANGGHNPPLIAAPDGAVMWLDGAHGMALGVIEGGRYPDLSVDLAPGSTLLCYTDGVTDANDPAGLLFGEANLGQAVAAVGVGAASVFVDAVLRAVEAFAAGQPLPDDTTCLAARWNGGEPSEP